MRPRSTRAVPAFLLLAASLAASSAWAQAAYDSTAFRALTWREIGIFRGGRAVAAAGSAARHDEYWMGTTGGGVFKTTDGGNTWLPAADKYFGGTVGAIAVSASNPDVVYVGTGEYPLRGNVSHGDGVFRTSDGGRTWTALGLAETQQLSKVQVHPTNPDIAYVAALGHAFGPNRERGVYKTSDGGKTWSQVLFRSDSAGASDLAMDPSNPDVLYAAFWQVQRTPWGLTSGGRGSGIFKTSDAGAHWTELTGNPGLPRGLWGNVGLTVSAAKPTRLWAIIEADSGGVYRSDDAGATWTWVNRDHKLRQRAWYYMRIFADPKDSNVVWAVNTGLYRSKDGGRTFDHLPDPHGDNHDLWIAPNDPQRMIESNDGGSNVSTNGGKTWTDQDYATAQFYHVTTTNHFPYRVCGAQQDNTGVCGPSRWPGGITRAQWYDVSGESGYIQARPDSADITYGGDNSGFLARVDHRTGFWRMVTPWPDDPDGHPASEGRYRFQWTAPLLISLHDPNILYAGANVLFKSTNGGQSWIVISPDLTRHDPRTLGPSGGPITLDQTTAEYYGTIFALAESPLARGTVWAGSDDGLIHLTRDGGHSWSDVTPRDLPAFTRISIIEASHFAPGTAYVAANRYQLEDPAPIILRTADYGRTWSRIVEGIPATEFVRTVREDPARRRLLFAGTERGVWVSFDEGGHWQTLRRNLPIVPVHDLAIKDGDLIAATHGRSFWILDDITPLESLSPEVVQQDAHLFPVRDPYRVDWGGSDAGSDAHPVGKNPASGAIIHYWLKTANQEVTLTILDSAGRVVRRFTSRQDSLTAADSSAAAGAVKARRDSLTRAGVDSVHVDSLLGDTTKDEDKPWPHRPPAPPRLSDKTGLNRFAWNLRHPGPAVFWGMSDIGTDGPVALPGRYRARLEVGGQRYEQTFRLKVDPRSRVTPAALREQFAFLERVRDTVDAVTAAIIRERSVRSQLEDRMRALAADAPARRGAQALADRLAALEDSLYQVRLQADEDALVYPSRAVERISALAGVVGGYDARPTQPSYDVFRLLAPDVQRALRALEDALRTGLPDVNAAFAAGGGPAGGRAACRRAQAAAAGRVADVLLRPPFENWYLRAWGRRRVWGPLVLPERVLATFLSAPYDLSPDFVLPPQWRRREHDHPRYARFCYALARGTGARRILEVGSSSGGTTTGWARALAEAAGEGAEVRLVCVDDDSYNPGVYPVMTGQNVERMGLSLDRVTFHCGDSRAVLPRLHREHPGYFDVYLVDAGHTYEGALADLEDGLPMVRPGGLIAVHDVDRARPMPEATAAHPAPVYDAVEHFARSHRFDRCIVGFVRKHLAVVQVRA